MLKLFLDSSVLLAASGSAKGGSYAVIRVYGIARKWECHTSNYCLAEVEKNISKLAPEARIRWSDELRPALSIVPDAWTMKLPHLLTAGKDKPVLITAISAKAKALLTLDTSDFKVILNRHVYGVFVCTPSKFLEMNL